MSRLSASLLAATLLATAGLILAACGGTDDAKPTAETTAPIVSEAQATHPEDCDPDTVCTPLQILRTLASDDMGGRQTGTLGNARARQFLVQQFNARALPVTEQRFSFEIREGEGLEGLNLLTRIEGKTDGPVIVITAHYDHVGTEGGDAFNGADDNASGVAGAFAVADHFRTNPPEHTVVIAMLDAEEMGLQGARALVTKGLPGGGEIALNMNFDMLSQSDKNELYAAGAFHYPPLKPMLETIAAKAPVTLKLGHDDPALGPDDWTLQSDHGPFHQAGIPFVYFGVEDHPYYHQPTDEFQRVPQGFYARSLETVVMAAETLDAELGNIAAAE